MLGLGQKPLRPSVGSMRSVVITLTYLEKERQFQKKNKIWLLSLSGTYVVDASVPMLRGSVDGRLVVRIATIFGVRH